MKKIIFSFSVLFFFILNIVYVADAVMVPHSDYESKPIDPAREGKDYHRDGNIIIYSSAAGNGMSFDRMEMDEGKMRQMAKEKLGDEFSEEEFQHMLDEMKNRTIRKDTFSYERSGYATRFSNEGPSYDGY